MRLPGQVVPRGWRARVKKEKERRESGRLEHPHGVARRITVAVASAMETGNPFRGVLPPSLGRAKRAKRRCLTGALPFSGDIYMFNARFRQKCQTNGQFPVCRRPVLVPMRIFSHRHENSFSWAWEFRLFVMPCSRPTGRNGSDGKTLPLPFSL